MDSDLAWVNGKSGRQRWRYADAFQRSRYNIGSHLLFTILLGALAIMRYTNLLFTYLLTDLR